MPDATRPRAVFRCDGGVQTGAGHLARCLTLADGLASAGWDCVFLVNSEAEAVFPRLFQSAHRVVVLVSEERLSVQPVAACGGDLLVVDHYQLGAAFEAAARDYFLLVMAIDDFDGRAHSCDILLNQNDVSDGPAANSASTALLLQGRQFALLAPQYLALRPKALARRREAGAVDRLLICFGASDPHNFCGRAAAAVLESRVKCRIDIVVSSASPNAALLRELQQRPDVPISLHFDTQRMAELMFEADLSIGAAGATTWERCCLGLPAVVYQIADNQAQIAHAISQQGAAWIIEDARSMKSDELIRAVETLSSDRDRRSQMAERASRMADGKGVTRVVTEIQGLLARQDEATNS